ncbi:MAG: ABC transporter ATP-binding protein [Lachnospiraceae bacterium]|nr:ABC transporter ATP-binding protein [Lachnospiraceae bacterium]
MKRRSGFTVMARLVGLVKPLTGYMILAVLMGFIGHLCAAFITILGGYAVLNALGFSTAVSVKTVFICVLLFALLRAVLRYAEQGCNHFIAFKLLAMIRDKVFQALRKLCPAKLEGRDKGDLISLITSDIELLEVFYAHTISPVAIAFLFTVVMSLFIGAFHPALGLLALLAYLSVGIIIPLVTSRLSGTGAARGESSTGTVETEGVRKSQPAATVETEGVRKGQAAGSAAGNAAMEFRVRSGELSSFVLDSLRGLSETIQYGQGEARLAEMNVRTDALSGDEKRMKRISGRNMAATNTVILFFDLCMLFAGAMLYQRGRVDFSGVLIPSIAMFASFGPVIALANLGSTLQSTFAAGNRVLDILDEKPVTEEITDGIAIDGKNAAFGGARAEKVRFSYGNEVILEDLSLVFRPGRITGVMGRSGSGKSTLLKLLMRFWKTDSGKISISCREIDSINTASLRNCESFVTQETHLFHDSIRNNLRIAKLDATEEEIEAACRKASVHDFIMTLPQGYDTPVGELGDTLSGGERQRLGLARAFLHDAPFLLLDEPTSNLDSLNEGVILKSLCEEGEDRTVVLVSHRQSTMRIADTVYTVESKTGRKS